jgi:hypothetical protein
VEREDLDVGKWEGLWNRIVATGLRLDPENGSDSIQELLIHIDGSEVWWRC